MMPPSRKGTKRIAVLSLQQTQTHRRHIARLFSTDGEFQYFRNLLSSHYKWVPCFTCVCSGNMTDRKTDSVSSRPRRMIIFLKKISILLLYYSHPVFFLMSVPARLGRLNNNNKHRGHTGSRSVLAKDLGKVSMYIHRCLVREHTQVSPFSQMR